MEMLACLSARPVVPEDPRIWSAAPRTSRSFPGYPWLRRSVEDPPLTSVRRVVPIPAHDPPEAAVPAHDPPEATVPAHLTVLPRWGHPSQSLSLGRPSVLSWPRWPSLNVYPPGVTLPSLLGHLPVSLSLQILPGLNHPLRPGPSAWL